MLFDKQLISFLLSALLLWGFLKQVKTEFFFQLICTFAKVRCDWLKNEAIVVHDLIIGAFLAWERDSSSPL